MKSLKRIAALIMTATAMITVNSCDTVGPETEGQKDESVVINISSITQTENSATLSGMVKMGKDVPAGTAIGIEYSANEAFPINDRTKLKINADSEGKFTVEIKNLNSDTDYYARTYVCKDGKTYDYGTPQKFHTAKATTGGGDEGGEQQGENNVVVTIDKIEGYVSEIFVTVSVSENPAGAKYGLQISSESDFDAQYTAETLFTPDASLKTTLGIKNLTVGATYYTKAYCTLNGKTNWSQASSFTVQADPVSSTEGISKPYVKFNGPSGRIGANITWPSDMNGYKFGVQISDNEHFEYIKFEGNYNVNDIDLEGRYTVNFSQILSPSTNYYIRNYMYNNGQYTYSDVVVERTEDITLLSKAESIASKSAKLIVNVDLNWASMMTKETFTDKIKFGFEVSDNTNFSNKVAEETNMTMENSFTSYSGTFTIPEVLAPNTKYYFRAFYTMNGGERIYQATDAGNFTTTQ